MTTTFDYVNRRFDLMALQGAKAIGNVKLLQQLFGEDGGEVCTGTQKLAQRWVLEFLTPRGSLLFLPNRGTQFVTVARRGGFRNEIDVISEYNFAAVQISQTLRNEVVSAMEDDERFLKDELLEVRLAEDLLQLRVQITSVAATSRKILLPVPFSPIHTGL